MSVVALARGPATDDGVTLTELSDRLRQALLSPYIYDGRIQARTTATGIEAFHKGLVRHHGTPADISIAKQAVSQSVYGSGYIYTTGGANGGDVVYRGPSLNEAIDAARNSLGQHIVDSLNPFSTNVWTFASYFVYIGERPVQRRKFANFCAALMESYLGGTLELSSCTRKLLEGEVALLREQGRTPNCLGQWGCLNPRFDSFPPDTPARRVAFAVREGMGGLVQALDFFGPKSIPQSIRELLHDDSCGFDLAATQRIFCDIFRYPLLPQVNFETRWRTEEVLGIARRMDASGDFSSMAALVDALEDADCDDPEVLAHARDDEPHVRGCWLIDLVLNRGAPPRHVPLFGSD